MNPMNHGHFYNLDTCKHLNHNRFDDEDVLFFPFLVVFFLVLFSTCAAGVAVAVRRCLGK